MGSLELSHTNGGISVARLFTNDTNTAILQQLTTLFGNLEGVSLKRPMHVEDCLNALRDTLLTHAEEIGARESLQDCIIELLRSLLQKCVKKGMDAFHVVFDLEWRDPHAKRSRCLNLLIHRGLDAQSLADATLILNGVSEILEENVRSTTDLLTDNLLFLINKTKETTEVWSRAASCEVLVRVVAASTDVIKRNPTLLELLTKTCSPLILLREAVERCHDMWHRNALIGLVITMVEGGFYDGAISMTRQIVDTLSDYIKKVTKEEQVVGVLRIISEVAASTVVKVAQWDTDPICDFLVERDWTALSVETRATAAYTMLKVVFYMLQNDAPSHRRLEERLRDCFLHDTPEVVSPVFDVFCTAIDDIPNLKVANVVPLVRTLRDCIVRLPYLASIFKILEFVRGVYGEVSVQPIYDLMEEFMRMDHEEVNYAKLDALLRFMGPRVSPQRPDFVSLRIDLNPANQSVPVLARSLPMLVRVSRTSQLPDALDLLFHPDRAVRLAAIETVTALCAIIMGSGDGSGGGGAAAVDIATTPAPTAATTHLYTPVLVAVERLLDVVVADRDSTLRLTALRSLTPIFNPYLCLPDNLESIFMARNDSDRATRDAALVLLCRLHPLHAAMVRPQLQRAQEYMLRDIEDLDASVSNAVFTARQLTMCADHGALLVTPTVVEKVVLQRLHAQPMVCKSLTIATLGLLQSVLANCAGASHCELAVLLQPLIPIIDNGDSAKRRLAALDTLRAVLTAVPMSDTTTQLGVYRVVARILRSEVVEEEAVTIAAMRVLGTIGAASPMKIGGILKVLTADEMEEEEIVTPALAHFRPTLRIQPKMAERLPMVVLYYLVKAIQLTIDPRQQTETLAAVQAMTRGVPSQQRAVLLSQFLPQLKMWLFDQARAHLYETTLALMTNLAVLLRQYKDVIPSSVAQDLVLSTQRFAALPQASQKPLSNHVVQLLNALARGLPGSEMREHRWALDFIHQRLSQDKLDRELVLRVVRSLPSFVAVMHERDVQLVLPHVLQCIEPADGASNPEDRAQIRAINEACFGFLQYVMEKKLTMVKDGCAQVIHTIMWYVELSGNAQEMSLGLRTMAAVVDAVQQPAQRFIAPVEKVAQKNGFPPGHFRSLVSAAAKGAQLPSPQESLEAGDYEAPLRVVSELPHLTAELFISEVENALRISHEALEVLDVASEKGYVVLRFRFLPGRHAESYFALFTSRARDRKSTLARNLSIRRVEQGGELPRHIDGAAAIRDLAVMPEVRPKKRHQAWIKWLHSVAVMLLRYSPYSCLRCCAPVAERMSDLARDIFPFAAAAVMEHLGERERAQLMDFFTDAVEMAPHEIKQQLFYLAEFVESERGERTAMVVRVPKTMVCVVERATLDQKFGINYDQDPKRGVIVTKLAPDGLGMRAGVPIWAQLLEINGTYVRSVGDIRGLIDGLSRVELKFSQMVEERRVPPPRPMMNLAVLARVAFDAKMHATAIFFNEALFEQLFHEVRASKTHNPDTLHELFDVTERLVEYYGHLSRKMAANGLVKIVARECSEEIVGPDGNSFDEIGTLEQLHMWGEALERYQGRIAEGDRNGSVELRDFVGALRCHDALGHVLVMRDTIERQWAGLDDEARERVVPYRAKAALCLGHWDEFDDMASDARLLERFGTVEQCAALFRQGRHDALHDFIVAKRREVRKPFVEAFKESYSRSYDAHVLLQHLTHFEELVVYVKGGEDRRQALRGLWLRRLKEMSSRPENVSALISINSLVATPEEDLPSMVQAVHVLIRQRWVTISGHMLEKLVGKHAGSRELIDKEPELIHACLEHRYVTNSRREAYTALSEVLYGVDVLPGNPKAHEWGRCWLLLGGWTMSLFPDRGDTAAEELLRATELSPRDSAPFHALGILHYDLSRDPTMRPELQVDHRISSVIALFKAVELSTDSSSSVMQDVVRILSIWFNHSGIKALNEAVHQGVQILADHVWLHVLPQLIARIGITAPLARKILTDLLVRVGAMYPHALIYPLTVAEKSPVAVRRHMAERVLKGIRLAHNQLVDEASLISNEMVRIAILWAEKWHAAIHAAAFKPEAAEAILDILNPHYDELERAATPNERAFEKNFGQALKRARAALLEGQTDRAWVFLKQVYGQLVRLLEDRRHHISDVSPTLEGINDSIVAVPGTFAHGQPLVTIQSFHTRVYVMPSKQRPRRFGINASDGNTYRFLLKGHEDMRQDERAMQFIALIDTIFRTDYAASSSGLSIPHYAVIPLTDNVGIVGWVENTETIYKMLESYRQEHGVSIYEEINIIIRRGKLRSVEDYHHLPKEHRKELLAYAMEHSPSDELRRIFWNRNDSCEQWLAYRGTFGQTLAAMSIVGYVLGLGDRHLNNLMLKEDGAVVHIDFGDCFEVAMHRALYAETVPFRLTRLLVAALGITGVDGVFRLTSELVMRNLRKHRENLLSILEAFIYDPLINWRLTAAGDGSQGPSSPASAGASAISGANGADLLMTSSRAMASSVLADEAAPVEALPMQLSRSFAKGSMTVPVDLHTGMDGGEEESRNQQGDLALARVQAKLTGQDFMAKNTSFSLQGSRTYRDSEIGAGTGSRDSSLDSSAHLMSFEAKFSTSSGPLLTTYLSHRSQAAVPDSLDVKHQVKRLIVEATSLDNLADAFLTGWAPFW